MNKKNNYIKGIFDGIKLYSHLLEANFGLKKIETNPELIKSILIALGLGYTTKKVYDVARDREKLRQQVEELKTQSETQRTAYNHLRNKYLLNKYFGGGDDRDTRLKDLLKGAAVGTLTGILLGSKLKKLPRPK